MTPRFPQERGKYVGGRDLCFQRHLRNAVIEVRLLFSRATYQGPSLPGFDPAALVSRHRSLNEKQTVLLRGEAMQQKAPQETRVLRRLFSPHRSRMLVFTIDTYVRVAGFSFVAYRIEVITYHISH